jgi:hypothetical protein
LPALPDYLASDREREGVADRLRDGAAEGRLDTEELERRLGAAYSARTRAELAALVVDLPPLPRRRVRTVGLRWSGPSRPPAVRDVAMTRVVVAATATAVANGAWLALAGARALSEYEFVDWYWPSVPMAAIALWLSPLRHGRPSASGRSDR